MFLSIKRNFYLILLLLAACLSACGTEPDAGQSDAPKGLILQGAINKLVATDDFVYAATDTGMFRKPKTPAINKWESLGLSKVRIPGFITLSDNILLASAHFGYANNAILKSLDAGESWLLYRQAYSRANVYPTALASYPGSIDTVFAAHARVKKSVDQGERWSNVSGSKIISYIYFLSIDPEYSHIMWVGGKWRSGVDLNGRFDADVSSQASLMKSWDGGKNWRKMQPEIEAPAIYDLVMDPDDHNNILIGTNGIYRSKDGGSHWQHVFKQDSIYTLTRSSLHPQTMYASGKNSEGTLFFIRSTDFGESWQITELSDSLTNVRINDMISVNTDGAEVLYFGTNKGVYSYEPEQL